MRKSLIVLAFAAVLSITAAPILADDINAPGWRYQDPDHVLNRSTLQWWEFGTNATNPVAEAGYKNPPGGIDPTAAIYPVAEWIDDDPDSTRQGIWALTESPTEGVIGLFIDNYSDGPEKTIWIQLTWKPQTHVPAPPEEGIPLIVGLADFTTDFGAELLYQQPLAEGWVHSTYQVILQPNPSSELIEISGDILVDEVVVDTICPEPATLILMGVGIPFLVRTRRRNRN